MTPRRLLLFLPLLAAASPLAPMPEAGAPAPPAGDTHITLHYTAAAEGMAVTSVVAELDLTGAGYAARADYRTTGLLRAILPSEQTSSVTGFWRGEAAAPISYRADGSTWGSPRHVLITYQAGEPTLRRLVPPFDADRTPIPAAMTLHTEDSLSALAQLIHVVGTTGHCDGDAVIYDGRRVISFAARTGPTETLSRQGNALYAGPALRCDVTAQLIGGIKRDAGAAVREPKHGAAWFAALAPGGPVVPVRMVFPTPWVGETTMTLTGLDTAPKPL